MRYTVWPTASRRSADVERDEFRDIAASPVDPRVRSIPVPFGPSPEVHAIPGTILVDGVQLRAFKH
jgi:hypothetical protein